MARKSKNAIEEPSKPINRTEFARRLYNLMLSKGWRQSELARRAGLPRDSVSTYIRGKVLPTAESVYKLAKAFGIPAEELLPYAIENSATAGRRTGEIPALSLTVSP